MKRVWGETIFLKNSWLTFSCLRPSLVGRQKKSKTRFFTIDQWKTSTFHHPPKKVLWSAKLNSTFVNHKTFHKTQLCRLVLGFCTSRRNLQGRKKCCKTLHKSLHKSARKFFFCWNHKGEKIVANFFFFVFFFCCTVRDGLSSNTIFFVFFFPFSTCISLHVTLWCSFFAMNHLLQRPTDSKSDGMNIGSMAPWTTKNVCFVEWTSENEWKLNSGLSQPISHTRGMQSACIPQRPFDNSETWNWSQNQEKVEQNVNCVCERVIGQLWATNTRIVSKTHFGTHTSPKLSVSEICSDSPKFDFDPFPFVQSTFFAVHRAIDREPLPFDLESVGLQNWSIFAEIEHWIMSGRMHTGFFNFFQKKIVGNFFRCAPLANIMKPASDRWTSALRSMRSRERKRERKSVERNNAGNDPLKAKKKKL